MTLSEPCTPQCQVLGASLDVPFDRLPWISFGLTPRPVVRSLTCGESVLRIG